MDKEQKISGNNNIQVGRDINLEKQPRPSYIAEVIEVFIKNPDFPISIQSEVIELPSEVKTKIEFNNLKCANDILDKWRNLSSVLDNTYKEYSETNPDIKERVYSKIKVIYNSIAVEMNIDKSSIKNITPIADKIFYDGIKKLKEFVLDKIDNNIYEEDIEYAVHVIFSDAFINCKFLENPLGTYYDSQ